MICRSKNLKNSPLYNKVLYLERERERERERMFACPLRTSSPFVPCRASEEVGPKSRRTHRERLEDFGPKRRQSVRLRRAASSIRFAHRRRRSIGDDDDDDYYDLMSNDDDETTTSARRTTSEKKSETSCAC